MAQVPFPREMPSLDITELQNNPEEQMWKGPFTFIQGADTQFGLIALKLNEPKPNWHREIALTREVIQRINDMNPLPKFFCICGDMLDAYSLTEPEMPFRNHPCGSFHRREEQYQDFVKVFQELDPRVKLVCVCGNHDMGDFPTQQSVQVYRRQFGPDYFSFWVGGVKFVVLNSQYMFAPEAVPEETQKQLEFLEEIKDNRAKHIVVFQHIPYFVEDPNEEENWNLNVPRPQRHWILDKLRESGVRYIFCGHYHKNAGGYYKDVEQVVTGSIGCPLFDDPSGYRICCVEEEGISHEYITLMDSTKFT